jgi:hypothetical protein
VKLFSENVNMKVSSTDAGNNTADNNDIDIEQQQKLNDSSTITTTKVENENEEDEQTSTCKKATENRKFCVHFSQS